MSGFSKSLHPENLKSRKSRFRQPPEGEQRYTFWASVWRRIRALEKRLAKDLAIVRLRRLAEEFCDDYEDAVTDDPPSSRIELDRMSTVAENGFRGCAFMPLRKYLERCIEDRKIPEPRDIVGNILPWAAKGLPPRPPLGPQQRSLTPTVARTPVALKPKTKKSPCPLC